MSDTITLIAGILLTSVGLLALLPFVLRLGRRGLQPASPLASGLLPALAAADAFLHPEAQLFGSASYRADGVGDDVEELMAHLFSLRMTVSEVTAEVQAVQDVIGSEAADSYAATVEDGPEIDEANAAVGHAA